ASALDCYECPDVENCLGPQQNNVVRCNDANSQPMYEKLSSQFYPKLQESGLRNGNYQCVSLRFTRQGEENPSIMFKGCLFETMEGLCRLDASPPNFGMLNCQSCNTDRCNSGSAALGWSILLVIASLFASSLLAK
ncbi:AAEL003567-PA, partial [Aedes aegypti]